VRRWAREPGRRPQRPTRSTRPTPSRSAPLARTAGTARGVGRSQPVAVGDVLYSAGDLRLRLLPRGVAEVAIMSAATPMPAGARRPARARELPRRAGPAGRIGGDRHCPRCAHSAWWSPVRRAVPALDGAGRGALRRDPGALMSRREKLLTTVEPETRDRRSALSPAAQALRHWAARSRSRTCGSTSRRSAFCLAAAVGARPRRPPVAITPTAVLRRATPGLVAENSASPTGVSPDACTTFIVVGAGPAVSRQLSTAPSRG